MTPRLYSTESGPSASVAAEVERFYDQHAFPGYSDGDGADALLDRCAESPFLQWLDRETPLDARILDCGCGTGQIAFALALRGPRRTVVALDRSDGQMGRAREFLRRCPVSNVHLVRGDLFSLPLAPGAFDTVVCRGVIHHTEDPLHAASAIAPQVAPGGLLVLGFYDRVARLPHVMRRAAARIFGAPIARFDPVLRRRDLSPEKKRAWIEDQYRHPFERSLTLRSVWRTLRASGFAWRGTFPSAGSRDPTAGWLDVREPGLLGMTVLELSWLASGLSSEDAGLVCLLARRHPRA